MTFFKNIWHKIVDDVTPLEKSVIDFASPYLHQMATTGYADLAEDALEAVMAAETTGGTGLVKFAAAKATFLAAIAAKGLPKIENLVNNMLETAVANVKANK